MERQWDYQALPLEVAAARLEAPVIVLGDGVAACRPFLARLGPGLREADPVHSLPSPAGGGGPRPGILTAGGGSPAGGLGPPPPRPPGPPPRGRRAAGAPPGRA